MKYRLRQSEDKHTTAYGNVDVYICSITSINDPRGQRAVTIEVGTNTKGLKDRVLHIFLGAGQCMATICGGWCVIALYSYCYTSWRFNHSALSHQFRLRRRITTHRLERASIFKILSPVVTHLSSHGKHASARVRHFVVHRNWIRIWQNAPGWQTCTRIRLSYVVSISGVALLGLSGVCN